MSLRLEHFPAREIIVFQLVLFSLEEVCCTSLTRLVSACGQFVCGTRISEAFSRSIMPKEGRGEERKEDAVAEIYCDPLKAD